MSDKQAGGPAFTFGQVSEVTGRPINGYHNDGMTLRDYFAAKAMQAYQTDPAAGWGPDAAFHCSQAAYRLADAMLKAREA